MAKKRKVIITNNKEIYSKFNMLHFSSEILLQDVKKVQIDRSIDSLYRFKTPPKKSPIRQ